MRAFLPSVCAVVLGIVSAGCGPSKGSVTGKVTLDGTPLKGGRVDFVNNSGGSSATAELNDDGTYTVDSLTAGEYSVTVTTEYLNAGSTTGGGGPMNMRPGGGPPMMPPTGGPPKGGPPKDTKMPSKADMPEGYKASSPGDARKKYVKIPGKYADTAQSGLTFTSPGGNQTHDIPLVGK